MTIIDRIMNSDHNDNQVRSRTIPLTTREWDPQDSLGEVVRSEIYPPAPNSWKR